AISFHPACDTTFQPTHDIVPAPRAAPLPATSRIIPSCARHSSGPGATPPPRATPRRTAPDIVQRRAPSRQPGATSPPDGSPPGEAPRSRYAWSVIPHQPIDLMLPSMVHAILGVRALGAERRHGFPRSHGPTDRTGGATGLSFG